MRKLLTIAITIAMITPAFADYRHRRYTPPAQHHHHRNVMPWIAGGLALGVLGGAYYYNQRQCWDEQVVDRYGYPVFDRYGYPVVRRFCN